ncbi:tripartite tricarboxylate transporter TctB family protein [Anaeromyxobacter sp. SG26]|uniref:tripartite tricarboxylate transporter TctB family protein n=1 Tax=Anaeromyxobacter sp. SG26 TaxID=2925407 RepID=UPI001F56E4EF|nr:tripartite tricarboxylate transporter TctB family protein [Anaeromyxobacter sp. SG26]
MVTAKKLVTRARLEGLVITLVALGYIWQVRNIPALFQMPGVPGPAAFPTLLGFALGVVGVWRLLRGAPAEEQAPDGEDVVEVRREAAAGVGARARGWLAAHGRFCGLWIVVLGYFVFMPELGFPLGSALALAAMGRLLGERRWPVVVGGAVVVTAVLHLAFAKGLGVRLPLGVLSFLGK